MTGVIYARYSSESQREESIEGQVRECQAYAEGKDIQVIKVYTDRALSGKTDKRPSFLKMVQDSTEGCFDVVLVWKFDRFSRNMYDSVIYKDLLKRNGVRVISATEAVAEGPSGILTENLLTSLATYYSAELAEKIHRGQTENALKCRYNGGTLPFGYCIDSEQKYQLDQNTAPLVKDIFQRYADGENAMSIVDDLNAKGIRTTRGGIYKASNINSLLRNRIYIGEYHYGETVVSQALPAIVDEVTFEQVQKRLNKNRRTPGRAKTDVNYILTTKLFCGECGAMMAGESGTSYNGKTYYYYKCSNAKRKRGCHKRAVKKEVIERFVVLRTKQVVLTDDNISYMADEILKYQQRENTTLPILRKQLADTERAISNLVSAIEQGVFSKSTKDRLDELEAEKEKLDTAILQEQLAQPSLTKEQIVFWISRFKLGNIDDPKYQEEIIDCFVNAVFVYDDHIKVAYNCTDTSDTVTLKEMNEAFASPDSSSLRGIAPPRKKP